MNKIEEILQKHTGCKCICECGCGLIEAMKEFGRIAFGAARADSFINDNGFDYDTYEDFLKEIDAKGND